MPRRVDRAGVIRAVAALPGARTTGRTAWVGIDGYGGAGKSDLAAAVAAADPRVVVVHADDFARPGVPEWEWARFRTQVVEPLAAGRPARYQVWAWSSDTGGDWVSVPPGRVIVLEGVSATRRELAVPWDLTVWVDAPEDVRLARALERDGPELMRRWREEWIPSENAYVARERPQHRVDLIVDGTA